MIITLCGSGRFAPWFHAWNEALTLAGHCVFSLGYFKQLGDAPLNAGDQKILTAIHREKIDQSRAVVFLNVCAYIGESTRAELDYALTQRKDVYFLESWGAGRGVGSSTHTAKAVARNLRYGVPDGYGSPIDTFRYPIALHSWLLGDGGPRRVRIVARLESRLADA